MTDISIIITAHREGILAGATIHSALQAIAHAEAEGASTECIGVLDKTDDLTRSIISNALAGRATLIETDHGDPGQSRNSGIDAASGRFATFLDGDDLWSENWLSAAWRAASDRPDAVWHSHCNIVFGQQRNLWWHVASEGPLYDPDYMAWANYWDAMSFAATDIYRDLPFRANDLPAGFGHEDWHWNMQTLSRGIAHKPVLDTLHFKRRRARSQMSLVSKHDAVIWPD